MNATIGIHEARQTLSPLVRKVDRTTEPVVIEINGKAMAALVPVDRKGAPFIPPRTFSCGHCGTQLPPNGPCPACEERN